MVKFLARPTPTILVMNEEPSLADEVVVIFGDGPGSQKTYRVAGDFRYVINTEASMIRDLESQRNLDVPQRLDEKCDLEVEQSPLRETVLGR